MVKNILKMLLFISIFNLVGNSYDFADVFDEFPISLFAFRVDQIKVRAGHSVGVADDDGFHL